MFPWASSSLTTRYFGEDDDEYESPYWFDFTYSEYVDRVGDAEGDIDGDVVFLGGGGSNLGLYGSD